VRVPSASLQRISVKTKVSYWEIHLFAMNIENILFISWVLNLGLVNS